MHSAFKGFDSLGQERTGVLKAYNGKFNERWAKSASMVTKFEKGKQVLAKINGKYWMYWGEKFINLAWSENLVDWYPSIDGSGNLKNVATVLKKRVCVPQSMPIKGLLCHGHSLIICSLVGFVLFPSFLKNG